MTSQELSPSMSIGSENDSVSDNGFSYNEDEQSSPSLDTTQEIKLSEEKVVSKAPAAPEISMDILKRIMRKNTMDVGTIHKEYIPLNWTSVNRNRDDSREKLKGEIYIIDKSKESQLRKAIDWDLLSNFKLSNRDRIDVRPLRQTKTIESSLSKEALLIKRLNDISKKIEASMSTQHCLTLSCIASRHKLPQYDSEKEDLASIKSHYSHLLNEILLDSSKQELVNLLVSLCKICESKTSQHLMELSNLLTTESKYVDVRMSSKAQPSSRMSSAVKEESLVGVFLKHVSSQLPDLIHYLWMVDLVEGSEIRISIAKALIEIPPLVEAFNETNQHIIDVVSWLFNQNIVLPEVKNPLLLKEGSTPMNFIKEIVEITKLIGDTMNKGYSKRQGIKHFNLDILPQLFKLKSTDENEKYCVFDAVLSSYLGLHGQKLGLEPLTELGLMCKTISKRLKEVCWSSNQLTAAFIVKRQEITNYYQLLQSSILADKEVSEGDDSNVYMDAIKTKLESIDKTVNPFLTSEWLPCHDSIFKMKDFLGQNLNQGVNSIVAFCQECIVYIDQTIQSNDRSKTKKHNRLIRSGSRGAISPTSDMRNPKNPEEIKENISNFANRSNLSSKLSKNIQDKLKGNKSPARNPVGAKKTKAAGGFLLKNACKPSKND